MKHMTWAILMVGLLVVGSALPAAAAGGGSRSGFPGGGSGWSGGAPRGSAWVGGGGFHGSGFQGGHGFHGDGFHGGTRVFIGGGVGWWGWPGWWGPSYPYYSYPYYADPPVVVPQAPTEYIQQAPAPAAEAYWYYCASAGTYYPYVKDCPGGWMQVVPAPTPSGP